MARKLRTQPQVLSGSPSSQFTAYAPVPIEATRAPTTADTGYAFGQLWVDTSTGIIYGLGAVAAGSATWNLMSPGASDVDTLTGDAGGAISPAGGNITLAGGTNIGTTGAGSTITFNLDAAITLATSVTSPIYTSAAAMDINVAAGSDITIQMGDAAGANVIDFEDSASATVASLNSNGQFSAVNLDGILGAVTPAAATATTITANTSVTSPLYTASAADALIQAGGVNDVVLRLGDAAGATFFRVQSSTPADVFTIDSTGTFAALAGLTVTGAFTQTAGAVQIGLDNAANAISIGGGNVARALSFGNSAAAHTITIGNAAAGAIAVDTAAGISLDAATASNFTVTGAADLAVASTAGGVNITSGEAATTNGITIDATAADGGVTIDGGTNGVNIATTVGCTVVGIGDIAPTAGRTITIGGGTVVTAVVTDTIDIGPDGADTIASASKVVNINTGGVALGTLTTNIGSGTVTSGTHSINIQSGNAIAGTVTTNISTGTGTKIVNLGNADGNTTMNLDGILAINNNVNAAVTINDGTSTGAVTIGAIANSGAVSIQSSSTIDLDAAGAVSLNSTGAAINIGNDANAFAINIGTGAAARTITLGNNSGATSVVVDVGTGAASFGATATAHTTTIGSTTGAAATVIQSGTGDITVTGTVKQIDAEFMEASGIYINEINASPLMTTAANTGGVATGATGDTNLMAMQNGVIMEQFILGAGQTIIAPRIDANGLLVSLDLTATEGAEYNLGARNLSKCAFTIGTDAAFYFSVGLYINDMDGAAPYVIGFRKVEANNATFGNYTDYATIGMIAASSVTNVVTATELNSGGQTVTDTTDAWGGDGATNTLAVLVSAGGAVTYTINGAAPSASAAFTFDAGDIVIPFIRIEHSASATQVDITSIQCGYQA